MKVRREFIGQKCMACLSTTGTYCMSSGSSYCNFLYKVRQIERVRTITITVRRSYYVEQIRIISSGYRRTITYQEMFWYSAPSKLNYAANHAPTPV